MSDTFTELQTKGEFTPGSTSNGSTEAGFDLSGRYSEIVGKLNETLSAIDWNLMGKGAKATGILLAVIVAQILIKGVLDTINVLPVIPGLLELLGLVIVAQWGWNNLRTGEKRSAVITQLQGLRRDYFG